MVGDHHHFENETGTTTNSTHASPGHLTLRYSARFTSCEWKDCKSSTESYGGAIFAQTQGISLFIDRCIFKDCDCKYPSSNQFGGSIWAVSILCISVTNSIFEWTSTVNKMAWHGGGIYLNGIPTVTILNDLFSKCLVLYYAAGIYIEFCSTSSSTDNLIDNCRCFGCKGDSGVGGAVRIHHNYQYENSITNSLFCECKNTYGGALYLNYSGSSFPASSVSSDKYPLKY